MSKGLLGARWGCPGAWPPLRPTGDIIPRQAFLNIGNFTPQKGHVRGPVISAVHSHLVVRICAAQEVFIMPLLTHTKQTRVRCLCPPSHSHAREGHIRAALTTAAQLRPSLSSPSCLRTRHPGDAVAGPNGLKSSPLSLSFLFLSLPKDTGRYDLLTFT